MRAREAEMLALAWGHIYMTSSLRGEGVIQNHDKSTDRLRDWDSDKGEGVQKSQTFADVICDRP